MFSKITLLAYSAKKKGRESLTDEFEPESEPHVQSPCKANFIQFHMFSIRESTQKKDTFNDTVVKQSSA